MKTHEAYWYHITFNAMHNLDLEDPTKMHAHTFRVGMYVIEKQKDHPAFFAGEHVLQDYFEQYQGIRLNELPVFKDTIPSLENIGNIFYEALKPVFEKNGKQLLSLEIGDSPTSAYCVGERLLLGVVSNLIPEGAAEEYCSRIRKRYEKRRNDDFRNEGLI